MRGLVLRRGNIVGSRCDAIINAANSRLERGGGVDGALHLAAGPALQAALRRNYPDGCPPGRAVVTDAFCIPVRFLIHAVGPVWRGGDRGEPDLLLGAYRHAFSLAEQLGCRSVASPSLSTGAFGYPIALAAPLALEEARAALARRGKLRTVEFVLFDSEALGVFSRAAQVVSCQGNHGPDRRV